MGTPRERMLRLLSLLQTGRRWPAPELADAVGCTPRTLRRDVEFLRDLGYPVTSVRGPGGHYQLVAGRSLPPLMLEDDEAIAAVLGLRLVAAGEGDSDAAEAAARAEQKVHRLLPTRLRTETEELLAAVDVAPTATGLPDVDLTASLTRAITDHVMLRFGYTSKRGTADREVEPVRLVRLQQHWYLYAWDRARSDWRTYRLDRITGRPEHGGRFVPRPLPADDLAAHLRERARGGPELTVTLVLHTSPADAASRLYRIDGTLEPLPGGVDGSRCRYTASVDSYAWLTFVLTISEVAFTVEDPEEFREYLARHAERLAKAVEGPVVFRED